MSSRPRHSYSRRALLIGLVAIAATGCGSNATDPALLVAHSLSECGGDSFDDTPVNKVLIDWSGGINQIYPSEFLEGIDLSTFETDDGGTLADDPDAFIEAVRAQVARIYCDAPNFPLQVVNGEGEEADYDVTIVHVTQELSPKGGANIGEGEYDPCNTQTDNAAILFGERLMTLGSGYTFDEWVNVFANTVAHEVAHTLGYAHVLRSEHPDSGRSIYVELMLDGHTMNELKREQRFVVEMDSCPEESSIMAKLMDAHAVESHVHNHACID